MSASPCEFKGVEQMPLARHSSRPARWAHLGGDVAIGVVLEVSGVLCVVKPDISKRWFCKPAGSAERP